MRTGIRGCGTAHGDQRLVDGHHSVVRVWTSRVAAWLLLGACGITIGSCRMPGASGPKGAWVTFRAAPSLAINVDQVFSLKEVPVVEPMAAVIPVVKAGENPIPGPEVRLKFQPLTADIVKDQDALVKLGKALFWDMQVGSDGVQSCATCHFNAGADNRSRNQISPGLNDANFQKNNAPNGSKLGGDNSFGNSTVPFTANDPLTPGGGTEPPSAGRNVPGHPGFAPNYQVKDTDFPLNDWNNPTLLVPRGRGVTFTQEFANVSKDTNDVLGSQGVRIFTFTGVVSGNAVEQSSPLPDIFNTTTPGTLSSTNKTRLVAPRNAPTVINTIFNYENLWDGRASFIFNGVNPFGFRDRTSTLKRKDADGKPKDVYIRITNSSLASNAVGPPVVGEMSFAGRTFSDIGKKMLCLQPLAKQLVHPRDSVLGPLSPATLTATGTAGGPTGLKVRNYAQMIKDAFQDQWTGTHILTMEGATAAPQYELSHAGGEVRGKATYGGESAKEEDQGAGCSLPANQYTQMQWNFSLFFGLAVQAYEATLISDDTPFDRAMGAQRPARDSNGKPCSGTGCRPIPPDPKALTARQNAGLNIFSDDDPNLGTHCADCHVPPVMTSHTILDYQPDVQGVPDLGLGEAIEFMIMGDDQATANYDHGMYNIGVRRTTEDKARGGTAPNKPPFQNPLTGEPFPLSLVELTALSTASQAQTGKPGKLPPDVARFVPNISILPRRATNGAFKAPNLRNLKFTGPYFHSGDSATLRQVVEFYTRGGNFPNTNLHDKTVDINGIPLLVVDPSAKSEPGAAEKRIQALVDFLAEGLKDPRVAFEKAPFDHPQLFVPNGAPDGHPEQDILMEIPAVGNDGRPTELPTFLGLDPQTP